MSFLNQLKTQAKSLQSQRTQEEQRTEENFARTEKACDLVHYYLEEAGRGLSVIQPPGPPMTLDGKTPWPAMKLANFRVDSRRKLVGKQHLFDTIALGWDIVPQVGGPVGGVVSVNFPPDLQRVEARLAMGPVRHERREVRHPESKKLLAFRFEYLTQTRGGVMATADHAKGLLHFRLMNTMGFEIVEVTWPAERIGHDSLDELAKRVAGQPSTFV